jgi:hypothetical protein
MKKLILLLIAGTLLFSCKKKNTSASTPEEAIAQLSGFHGLFIAEKYSMTGSSTTLFMSKVALHSSSKPESSLIVLGEDMGTVKSNGISLQFQTALRMYMDTSGKLDYSKEIKFEHNSSTLGDINFVNTDPFIDYPESLAPAIDDTLDRGKNYVIPLTGLSGFNKVACLIKDPFNTKIVSKSAVPGATEIVFSPGDLVQLESGKFHSVRIVVAKFNDQTINGKKFRFENDSYLDLGTFVK